MPDRAWKREERRAAALVGGRRKPANTGGPLDFETASYVGQVKHRARLGLGELARLALEVERIGFASSPPRSGLVIVKPKLGRGRPTPRLIVCTEAVWRELHGAVALPSDGHGE